MIQVSDLSKSYGSKQVLHNLSFTIPEGHVTGFLGPNGSGKSTTMRCILGLDRPSAGSVEFSHNGEPLNFKNTAEKARVVGSLLDPTWFAPNRSARAHLQVLAAAAGIGNQRVNEVLHLVGLESVAKRKMKTFSLGMKQRVGIAGALLGDPQYLFFDEPVNGLDPEGVRWVRDFVRQEAARGRGVFISSHLLSEMQQTADRIVMLGKGKLLGEYTMKDFLGGGYVVIEVDNPQVLVQALATQGIQVTVHQNNIEVPIPENTEEASFRRQLSTLCQQQNLSIFELYTKQQGLEERFLQQTGEHVEFVTNNQSA